MGCQKYSIFIKLFLVVFFTLTASKISSLLAQYGFPEEIIITESDLPIVYITSFGCTQNDNPFDCRIIPETTKKNIDYKIIDNENGAVNELNEPYTLEGRLGIEKRGDLSLEKLSYSIETRDIDGDEENIGLFGFPRENDWIFYGPYLDKSLIRNALVYDLVTEMGWYAPRTKFFNLVKEEAYFDPNFEVLVEPVYEGIYVLIERIKRDNDRVDISELKITENGLPGTPNEDVTGGYIVQVDEVGGPFGDVDGFGLEGWLSFNGNWKYAFEYPDNDDITLPQKEYIRDIFDGFEKTMSGASFNDPSNDYSAIISVESFIDFIIVQEFTKNVDGYRQSSYFNKDKIGKDPLIYAGPVWDFNMAMGNTSDFEGKETTGFQYNFNSNFADLFTGSFNDPLPVPNYWPVLMTNPEFVSQLKCRYTQLRSTVLSDENVFGKIDSLYALLKQSADLNYEKYPVLGMPLTADNEPSVFNTYQESVEAIKTWLESRFAFLDSQWLGEYFDIRSTASAAICPGDEVTLSVEAIGNVTGLYDWAIGDNIIASQIGNSLTIDNADPTITYTVTGYNESCSDTAQLSVNVAGFALASGGGNKSICPSEIDTLEARGAVSYLWSPSYGFVNENDLTSARPLVSPEIDTVYQVILTTADGCDIIDSVKVNVKRSPPLLVNEDITTCIGAGVQLMATADSLSSFNWLSNPADVSLDTISSKTANPFVQPDETTQYTVIATGDNNCTSSDNVNVEVLTDTNINFGNYTACNGEIIEIDCPNINATSVLWQPGTGLSNANILCPQITALQNIEYSIRAEISEGCIFTGTLQVNISAGNAINAGTNKTVCAGTIVQLNAQGGSGSFLWEGSNDFSDPEIPNPTIILNETTTLKVSSLGNGTCVSEDEITINVTPNPLSVSDREIVKCENDDAVQLEASGADSFNWNPSSGLTDNTISDPLANPNETTTYTVFSIIDNCIFEDSVKVTITTNEDYFVGESLTLCSDSDGQLSASGGVEYNWQPATGLDNPTAANPIVSANQLTDNTTYEVTITDTNGCIGILSQTVNLKSNNDITVTNEVTICSGGQTALNAAGGTTYNWEVVSGDFNSIVNNVNTANPTVSPTTETVYSVNITDADGCNFSKNVTVKIADNIVTNAGEDQAICKGQNIKLSAAGGTQYLWTNNNTLETFNGQEFNISPNETTTYTVTVSDGSCQGTDEVIITVNSLPVPVVVGSSSICNGQSTTLSVNEHQTYKWSSSNNANISSIAEITVNPTSTTIYTVEVSNENGCTKATDFELMVNPIPEITINEIEPICAGDAAQLSASVNISTASLSWSTDLQPNFSNSSNPEVSPTETTQYTLEAQSGNCSSSASTLLIVNPLPIIEISQSPIGDCNSSQIQLIAAGGVNYNWQPSGGLSNANIANPITINTELTNYTVVVTDESSCTNTATIQVEPSAGLIGSVSEDVSICRGESVNLQASGGDKYEWFPSGSLNDANASNPIAKPNATTEYSVKITDSATNCSQNKTVTVSVKDLPVVEAGAATQQVCEGEAFQLQLQASTNSSIEWSPETGLSNNTIANPTVNINQDQKYTVTVISENGCAASDEVNIVLKPKPSAYAGNDVIICSSQQVELNATSDTENVTFNWTPIDIISNPFSQTTTADINRNTTIILTVTANNNCIAKDTLQINLGNKINASVNDAIRICEGGSATLYASGGTSYEWSPTTFLNNPNIANPTVSFLENIDTSIVYTVKVSDNVGCFDTKQVQVSSDNEIQPDAGENISICLGESIQLFAAGGISYNWTASPVANNIISNNNIFNPEVSPLTTTTFTVNVEDGSSCNSGTDFVVVEIVEELAVNINQSETAIFPGQTANLEASGADTYEWFTDDTSISCNDCSNADVSPILATEYIVKGTSGSCVGYDTVFVDIKTCNLQTNITEDLIICGETKTVQLDFAGTNSYNYEWSSNNNSSLSCTTCPNPMASPNTTTTYTVKISDAFCETTETVTVTVLEGAFFFPQSNVQLCNNETLAYSIADLTAYTIQPKTGYTITNDSLIISPTINRLYTLTGKLSDGCSFVEQLNITIKNAPQINLGNDQFLCAGKAVTLNENFNIEGAEVNWLPATGLNNASILSPVAQPESTTTYSIQILQNGCTIKDEVTINVIPNNFASVSKDVTICEGGKAQLSATGGVNYTWSPANFLNDANISTPIASPNTTEIYEVAVENENGCIDTKTVKVKIGNQLQIKLNDSFTICKDGNGAKLNASGAFSYNWEPALGLSFNNIANPTANPTNTTIYTLTASDGVCSATETATVNVINQSLTASAGEDISICLGDTIQIKASGGLAYLWNNAESLSNHTMDAPLATPNVTTTYTVTTANIFGCTDFDEITVFVKEGDNDLSVSSSQIICQGETTQLGISFKQGYQYKWSPAGSLNNPNITNPVASPKSTTVYEVEVTNLEACTSVYSVVIEVVGLDAVSAGDNVAICKNETIQLNATGSESYLWNVASTLSNINIANPIASPVSSTNYVVQLQYNGCSKTDTVLVEVVDLLPFAETENITVCEGSSITLSAAGGDNYNWTSEDFTFPQANLQHQTIVPSQASSSYEVEISKANCVAQKQFEVVLASEATYSLNPTFEVCQNGTVQLNLEGENLSNISWLPTTGLSNSAIQQPIATIAEPVNYVVNFTVNNTCIAQASTSILLIDELNLTTNAERFTICEDASQTLVANSSSNASISYQWSANGNYLASGNEFIAQPNTNTTYTVTASSNECSTSKNVIVNVIQFGENAGSNNNFEVCIGDDAQLIATGGENYIWEPAALLDNALIAEPMAFNITEATQFYVDIKIFGCTLRDSLIVSPKDCLVEFIPNSFTPNNDGVNDTWIIPEITRTNTNQLYIYNRWGQLVYSAVNYQNDWNGTFNDTPLPEATYYYVLKITEESETKGTVTIIR